MPYQGDGFELPEPVDMLKSWNWYASGQDWQDADYPGRGILTQLPTAEEDATRAVFMEIQTLSEAADADIEEAISLYQADHHCAVSEFIRGVTSPLTAEAS